ncbi:MAG: alpha/beta hydrolase [Rhizobacter sp.]|nr:alpha/beta hydrolase [Rhizobacter sp.]
MSARTPHALRRLPTWLALFVVALAGCAGVPPIDDPALQTLDTASLPPPDVALQIPGLGPCTDNPDRTLRLNSHEPVHVLVHGCYGSSGRFRGLAQVLAFHGQQTACFTYNDRDSMMRSSAQLVSALDQLAQHTHNRELTVIGHSQGALVARKALVADRQHPLPGRQFDLRLVTVSGPFGGIASAHACGSPVVRALTLGLIAPMCLIATGDKWSEITDASPFITQPGALEGQVRDYLKIVTDERGTCRRVEGGRCVESDDIFSLSEQHQALIDGDPRTRLVQVAAGHVEIVGDERIAPLKLIELLQREGVLKPTPPEQRAHFERLLARVYGK